MNCFVIQALQIFIVHLTACFSLTTPRSHPDVSLKSVKCHRGWSPLDRQLLVVLSNQTHFDSCICYYHDSVCRVLSRSVISDTLQPHGLQPTRLPCPWNFPGKFTGLGCHFLLQGIFPTQGLNPRLLYLLHWQMNSLPVEPPGKPIIKTGNFKQNALIIKAPFWHQEVTFHHCVQKGLDTHKKLYVCNNSGRQDGPNIEQNIFC